MPRRSKLYKEKLCLTTLMGAHLSDYPKDLSKNSFSGYEAAIGQKNGLARPMGDACDRDRASLPTSPLRECLSKLWRDCSGLARPGKGAGR